MLTTNSVVCQMRTNRKRTEKVAHKAYNISLRFFSFIQSSFSFFRLQLRLHLVRLFALFCSQIVNLLFSKLFSLVLSDFRKHKNKNRWWWQITVTTVNAISTISLLYFSIYMSICCWCTRIFIYFCTKTVLNFNVWFIQRSVIEVYLHRYWFIGYSFIFAEYIFYSSFLFRRRFTFLLRSR